MMNGTLTGVRATAMVTPTIDDDFTMPPATGYGKSDPCGRPGFTWGSSDSLFHETPAPQDLFATAPMKAMWREFDWQPEEEAYTSFEAAISNRVLALKKRHINTYMEMRASGSIVSALHTLASAASIIWHKVCHRRVWRRGLLSVGLALMLMLVGFDLMGLLVLYAR